MPFYYLTANIPSDVLHNQGPIASLRRGGELISVDFLKITLLYISFLYFYKETSVRKKQNTSQIRYISN